MMVNSVMVWKIQGKGALYHVLAKPQESVPCCSACLRFRQVNTREPMIPHDITDTPFTKITFQGAEYLVMFPYYSKYPEVAQLGTHKTVGAMISHLKGILARHGIPEEIVADNVPFNSAQFWKFAQDWNITLSTSRPTYPQSNDQAGRMV